MDPVRSTQQLEEERKARFYVYILKGARDWHYCGITSDMYRRYLEHNSGQSVSTKKNGPYVLRWMREYDSRAKARFVEVMIKKQGVKRWMSKAQFSDGMREVMFRIELFYHGLRAHQ